MQIKNEKFILNFIKYAPIIFVTLISLVITQVFILKEEERVTQEITHLKSRYINENKERVKEEVEKVYSVIQNTKAQAERLLKERIKQRVYEAHSISTTIYNQELSDSSATHEHSAEHIFNTIKLSLGAVIYNKGRGYFFIYDKKGKLLLQPLYKEFENQDMSNFVDAKGYAFVLKMIDTLNEKSESYDTYHWYKSKEEKTAYKKVSFYKYFEPFDVIIGTGEYLDDFENELKAELIKKIQKIRYKKTGYIFAYDYEGNSLSHFRKDLIGINRINAQDSKGNYVVQNVIKFAKEHSGEFYHYDATVKTDDSIRDTEKISYIKKFDDWNWAIGSGFYMDALNQEIEKVQILKDISMNETKKNIIVISVGITLVFILLSFFISKILKQRFYKYKKSIDAYIENIVEKEKLLTQQSKMATMGEMIANITHQWKQPLGVISLSIGIIKYGKEDGIFSQEQIDNSAEEIENANKYLSTTIDDFRDFFNPNKSKGIFNIGKAFEKTLKLVHAQFKNYNIKIVKNIDDIEIFSYENELLQVLINILKNAKEELEKSKTDEKFIFIDVTKEEKSVVIRIKDNAGGIPENILEKVFDSYFTTKGDKGTGIGLYMSKQIIEKNMEGKLSVKNVVYTYEGQEFKGAEFTIELPLKVQ